MLILGYLQERVHVVTTLALLPNAAMRGLPDAGMTVLGVGLWGSDHGVGRMPIIVMQVKDEGQLSSARQRLLLFRT